LRGANLSRNQLDGSDFTGADVADVDLTYAEMTKVMGMVISPDKNSWKAVDQGDE